MINMAKQWGIDFKEFDYYVKKIESLSSKDNLRKIANKALIETHKYLTPKIDKQIEKHKRTGRTKKSLKKDSDTQWTSDVGAIDVGFEIHNGGLASIFLMYGTPKQKPDKELYNLFYGSKIKKEVFEIQQKIFDEELSKLMN